MIDLYRINVAGYLLNEELHCFYQTNNFFSQLFRSLLNRKLECSISNDKSKKKFFNNENSFFLEKKPIAFICKDRNEVFHNRNALENKIDWVFFVKITAFLKILKNDDYACLRLFIVKNQIKFFILIENRFAQIDRFNINLRNLEDKLSHLELQLSPPSSHASLNDAFDQLRKTIMATEFILLKLQKELKNIPTWKKGSREKKEEEISNCKETIAEEKIKICVAINNNMKKLKEKQDWVIRERLVIQRKKQMLKTNIWKDNDLLSTFFQDKFCVFQNLETVDKRIKFSKLIPMTPTILDSQSRFFLHLSKKKKTKEDLYKPVEIKKTISFYKREKINIPDDHPYKQTIENLLNPNEPILSQVMGNCLKLLHYEKPNFDWDPAFLSFNYSFEKLHLNPILPLQSEYPLIMVPIGLRNGENRPYFLMICIDKLGKSIELYDPLAEGVNQDLLNQFANIYFSDQGPDIFSLNSSIKIKYSKKKTKLARIHPVVYCYEFCKARIEGKSFDAFHTYPPTSMEMLGLKYQLIDQFLRYMHN